MISNSFVNEENAHLCQASFSESRGQNNESSGKGPCVKQWAENKAESEENSPSTSSSG